MICMRDVQFLVEPTPDPGLQRGYTTSASDFPVSVSDLVLSDVRPDTLDILHLLDN